MQHFRWHEALPEAATITTAGNLDTTTIERRVHAVHEGPRGGKGNFTDAEREGTTAGSRV